MILETYQEQQAIVQQDPPGQSFATVGTVYDDGIALIFNGAAEESLKHYKCNTCVKFVAGQRVRIIEDSGTYVVEYPVGAPAQSIYADEAKHATTANEANHAETADAHTAKTIGFFGQKPVARAAGVHSVSENASLSALIVEWNALVSALDVRGYGLID